MLSAGKDSISGPSGSGIVTYRDAIRKFATFLRLIAQLNSMH
jgi:hypothetical protein